MMEKVYIGKVVSTHGIKGEIRIISDFPYKEKAFKVGTDILINNCEYTITSYRRHKNYDMITLKDYTNINDVMFLMRQSVYKEKSKLYLEEDEILDSELMNYKVLSEGGQQGEICEIFFASPTNKVLRVKFIDKEILIPFFSPLIKKVDYKNKEIIVEVIEGM